MRDNKGPTAFLSETTSSYSRLILVVLTIVVKATGIGLVKTTVGNGKNDILKAIKNYFSPEFLGRLDDIVYYNSLHEGHSSTLLLIDT